jgi:beta-mannosidase
MKRAISLDKWQIKRVATDEIGNPALLLACVSRADDDWIEAGGARQVHEILMSAGVVSASVIEDGAGEYCRWVGDCDWVYRCAFAARGASGAHFLTFQGLDTVCDIFLNGEHVAASRTMYLPCRIDVSTKVKPQNEILVYFHRHAKVLKAYQETMPEAWKASVPVRAMLRKSHDYGARDGYSPIGIFAPVLLETVDRTEIARSSLDITLNLERTAASAVWRMTGPLCAGTLEAELVIQEQDGSNPVRVEAAVTAAGDEWRAEGVANVQSPRLWWPRNYGPQPLYTATFRVSVDGEKVDEISRTIGFRDVRLIGSMKFEVNGVPVRFWGANIAPISGSSNRFDRATALDLIDKADKGNINALRVWGPNKPYPDDLYAECDRRGIMLWQDFPTGGSELPDSPDYVSLLRAEAEHMVERLKSHPAIMLWCGGNENIYMCELRGTRTRIGFDMLTHGYREVCLRLDPHRYYHVSCPSEGRYTNDPAFGDSHGSRALRSYCAGEQYGVFYSENIRTYPPQLKSLRRFLKDEVWDEGWVDTRPFGCQFPMPAGWRKRLGNHGERKLGPIGDYYSATNVQQLVYKFTAAAGQDIYEMLARSRRGKPAHKSHEESICTGHMMWKLNDPWPNFYCAFVDYYGEPTLPYYAAKRAFAPFMVNLEVGDHIYAWGINDTARDVSGTLEIKLFDIEEFHAVRGEFSIPAAVPAGQSVILTNLDRLGFFFWETVVYARFVDAGGNVLSTAYGYVTRENMLPFPDAHVSLSYDQGLVTVRTDKFARCIELSGSDGGDEFGWFFEDNYFDLLPFETRTVRLYGNHGRGTITAKAQYATRATTVEIQAGTARR